MEETAAKPYNRVEKLADVFSAPRRSRAVNPEKSFFPAKLSEGAVVGRRWGSGGLRERCEKRCRRAELPEKSFFPAKLFGTRRRWRRATVGRQFRRIVFSRKTFRDASSLASGNRRASIPANRFFPQTFRETASRRLASEGATNGKRRKSRCFGFSERERGVRSFGRVR